MSIPTTQPSTDASVPAPPGLEEYTAAIDASYKLTTPTGTFNKDFTPPEGFTVVARSDPGQIKDGFSAVALKSDSGNIIIAFEGTSLNSAPADNDPEKAQKALAVSYGAGSFNADLQIKNGYSPKALDYAADFAKDVEQKFGGPIYVAGHSLGGTEAQSAARALGANFGGGVTFGATGLPGNDEKGPQTLVNYVDYGDPVGNFATDGKNAPAHTQHYGKVEMTGRTSNSTALDDASQKKAELDGPHSQWDGIALNLAIASDFNTGLQFHKLDNYKADLDLPAGAATRVAQNGAVLKGAGATLPTTREAATQPDGAFLSPTNFPSTLPTLGGPVKGRG